MLSQTVTRRGPGQGSKTRDYLRIPGGAVLESQKISGSHIIPAIAMDGDVEYAVIEIGEGSFFDSKDMISVIIPNSVTKIGFQAFYGCISLLTVYCESEEPIIGDDGLFSSSTYSDATLYVPVASVEKYREVSPWKNFTNIEGRNFSDIDAVAADIEMGNPHEVYNLGGVRVSDSVDGLAPGIYIVRQGNNAKKIAVK